MSNWERDPSGVVEALAGKPKRSWWDKAGEYLGDKYVSPIVQALSLPGDVYSGKTAVNDPETGHTSQDVIQRSANLGGLMTLGSGAIANEGTVNMGIRAPAWKSRDGQLFEGSSHYDALARMGKPDAELDDMIMSNRLTDGFVNDMGEFVDRKAAFQEALRDGQLRPDKLEMLPEGYAGQLASEWLNWVPLPRKQGP